MKVGMKVGVVVGARVGVSVGIAVGLVVAKQLDPTAEASDEPIVIKKILKSPQFSTLAALQ
jgi:hypothetical protein